MKKIRLYQNTAFKVGDKVELDKDNSHHLLKVLRFATGRNITLFNGDGQDYCANVISAKNLTLVEIISKQINDTESKLDLTLAQGSCEG